MAAQQAPAAQYRAAHGTVLLQGVKCVGRTTGLKTAGITQPRLQEQAVAPHQQHQPLLRPGKHRERSASHGFSGAPAQAGRPVRCALPDARPQSAPKGMLRLETAGANAPATNPAEEPRRAARRRRVPGVSTGCASQRGGHAAWARRNPSSALWASHPQAGGNLVQELWITLWKATPWHAFEQPAPAPWAWSAGDARRSEHCARRAGTRADARSPPCSQDGH